MSKRWEFTEAKGGARCLTVLLMGACGARASAVFCGLTGMHRHAYNRLRRRNGIVEGIVAHDGGIMRLLDLPYNDSLAAVWHYIGTDDVDAVAVVCDAAHPERDLALVLRILEITRRVVVCVDLPRNAAGKGIRVDLKKLSDRLGVPVTGAKVGWRRTLTPLLYHLQAVVQRPYRHGNSALLDLCTVKEIMSDIFT